MFYISKAQQKEENKNLKIVIKLKECNGESESIVEFQTFLENASFLSDLISLNIEQKGTLYIYNQDIILKKEDPFDKTLFKSLSESIFNNDQVKYSKDNYTILLKISEIFQIPKLKTSIERFINYLDQLNQYISGRLPIIDEEFLCQLYLLDLKEDNIEDTKRATNRFLNEITSDSVGQIFYRCIFCRLSKSELYLDFIVNKLENYTQSFIQTLIRNYRFYSFSNVNDDYNLPVICYLLRYFIENNFLKRDDEESFNYQRGWRSYTYQFFDFDDGNIHYDATYYVYRHYDELTKDNYSLHRKLVLNGKNQNHLFQIIEKDDLESLKKLIAYDPSFDIDTTIESCYYESRPLFQYESFSLIEIAAFFGSINIFKFLVINNAIIRKKELQMMALYGGNSEIIRICEQKDIEFLNRFQNDFDTNEPFYIVIKMHYFDLLRWLFEREEIDFLNINFDKLIGYSLRCSNFAAFYYLIKIYCDNYESNEENISNFKINFKKFANDLVLSYNIPVLKNYLEMQNEDLQKPSNEFNDYNKNFFEILLTNNDTDLIDIFLKDNKIDNLEKIPYNNMSSLTYQKMGKFFIKHKNVTYSSELLADLIEDLLRDELKNNKEDFQLDKINNFPIFNKIKTPEFISQQVQFLYESALTLEDVVLLLPVLFKYNLYENDYEIKYKEILQSNYIDIKFSMIEKYRNIFIGFIKYTTPEIFEFVLKRMYEKSKRKYGKSKYILGDSLKNNKVEMFKYLITSDISPYSKQFKFDNESFFNIFFEINSIETLQKVVQIYVENCKDCDFYNDIFLPQVLFHAADSNVDIIEYLLNIPEIENFINKENEKFSNLPPLLYLCRYYISDDIFKPFTNNEKVDINVRDKINHRNILAFTSNYQLLLLVLSNKRFILNPEDATLCIENDRYPGTTEIFELFLNGLLYENDETHKNPLNLKIDFTNEQLSRIFNKLCIKDERVELAKRFYSKFSDRIDVNYKKDEKTSFCLLDAIDCKCDKMVNFLLGIPELDLNRRGSTGSVNSHMDYTENITPFCFAVVCNIDEIIHLFFNRKKDFDVNETFSKNIFFY